MTEQDAGKTGEQGISKLKLALGAASLFLFIIGVKRTFQMDDPEHQRETPGRPAGRKEPGHKERKKRRR